MDLTDDMRVFVYEAKDRTRIKGLICGKTGKTDRQAGIEHLVNRGLLHDVKELNTDYRPMKPLNLWTSQITKTYNPE